VHAGETAETGEGPVGSAVNIAARVCAQARAGELLVTDTVRSLTRTRLTVRFTPRGNPSLKGIREPISLFAVQAAAESVQADPEAAGAWAGGAHVVSDPRTELDRVTCPCLCLWGASDNWVRLDDGMEYARRLRTPLRTIAGCGHLLIGERPDACLAAIEEFVASLDA